MQCLLVLTPVTSRAGCNDVRRTDIIVTDVRHWFVFLWAQLIYTELFSVCMIPPPPFCFCFLFLFCLVCLFVCFCGIIKQMSSVFQFAWLNNTIVVVGGVVVAGRCSVCWRKRVLYRLSKRFHALGEADRQLSKQFYSRIGTDRQLSKQFYSHIGTDSCQNSFTHALGQTDSCQNNFTHTLGQTVVKTVLLTHWERQTDSCQNSFTHALGQADGQHSFATGKQVVWERADLNF